MPFGRAAYSFRARGASFLGDPRALADRYSSGLSALVAFATNQK